MAIAVRSSIGFAGIHDGSGNRSHPATSPGEVPGSKTADHLRQWTAVHRPRLQGVHSHRGYDARADITLLPAIERQTGALAQIAKVGVHPTRHTVDEGRCAAPDSNLRGSLQHRTLAQRHRLCDAARYARRATGRDPRCARTQARGSTSPTAAAAGGSIDACTFFERDYNDLAR